MKHLVVGAGNLGLDIYQRLERNSEKVERCSLSTGWNLLAIGEEEAFLQYARRFDVVWYCLGYGSVNEAKENSYDAHRVHVELPKKLIEVCPYVFLFSSDYVADEKSPQSIASHSRPLKSHYAHLKWLMECAVCQSENATAIRVGSLYGSHKPMSTFPGRLLNNVHKKNIVKLPINLVTPTSTSWLAEILMQNFDRLFKGDERIHHAAPHGFVTVREWGSMILEKPMTNEDTFFDYERPLLSCLGTSFADHQTHWLDRWNEEWTTSLRDRILSGLQS